MYTRMRCYEGRKVAKCEILPPNAISSGRQQLNKGKIGQITSYIQLYFLNLSPAAPIGTAIHYNLSIMIRIFVRAFDARLFLSFTNF